MTPEDIEVAFIREFSVGGLQIGKSPHKADRRERVRQAIYVSGYIATQFHDTPMTYAEAFRVCYGERLDRRAALRDLVDPGAPEDEPDEDESDDDEAAA
jgi:hypothetical protein